MNLPSRKTVVTVVAVALAYAAFVTALLLAISSAQNFGGW